MRNVQEPLTGGDVVVRGTDPQRMTIQSINEDGPAATCQWFDAAGQYRVAQYRLDELRRASPESPKALMRKPIDDKTIECIAAVVHEANRGYCETQGDTSQAMWLDAPYWQRESARNGVRGILEGRITRPEQSHESWLAEKVADGWTYGPTKNPETKQHPCMVPYAELPGTQRVKDHIFFGIVKAMAAFHDAE